jgi:hypothetical protein
VAAGPSSRIAASVFAAGGPLARGRSRSPVPPPLAVLQHREVVVDLQRLLAGLAFLADAARSVTVPVLRGRP